MAGISIHAPARGATFKTCRFKTCKFNFNPRTREGCDAEKRKTNTGYLTISIHAPARGATDYLIKQGIAKIISIHAPARGATRDESPKGL